jgi:hypothetical protein
MSNPYNGNNNGESRRHTNVIDEEASVGSVLRVSSTNHHHGILIDSNGRMLHHRV